MRGSASSSGTIGGLRGKSDERSTLARDRLARRPPALAAAGTGGAMTVAARMRLHRRRYRQGIVCMQIPVDLLGVVDLLIATGHLQRTDADNTAAIREALADFVSDHVNARYA